MRRFRRHSPEVRIEMTPLLDVVFLLLTFFVFALLLMVRADVLGVSLPSLSAAGAASGAQTITVTVNREGETFVDGEAVPIEEVARRVADRLTAAPEARVLLAVDTGSSAGLLMRIFNDFVGVGIEDFSFLGREGDEPEARDGNESAPASEAGAMEDPSG